MADSPITYRLSSRQEKELLVRDTTLQLVLPIPYTEEPCWSSWAKRVLPAKIRPYVAAARECEVWTVVLMPRRPDDEHARNLTVHLGRILSIDEPPRLQPGKPPRFARCLLGVLVTLRPANPRRKIVEQPSWPKDVEFLGRVLPALGDSPEEADDD